LGSPAARGRRRVAPGRQPSLTWSAVVMNHVAIVTPLLLYIVSAHFWDCGDH
jgi:hypothetical protein